MAPTNDLKPAWLAAAERELKGRTVKDLNHQLAEGVRLSPVYARGEVSNTARPAVERGWEIGEYLAAGPAAAVNAAALHALEGGVEAPLFYLSHQPDRAELAEMLRGVRADFISLNCAPLYPGRDPAELFRDLVYYLRSEGYDLSKISGSVDFDPFLDWSEPPFPPLIRLLGFVNRYMPEFRVLQVNGRLFHDGNKQLVEELALIIAKGAEYLQQVKESGMDPRIVNDHLQFSVAVSGGYFPEIAKLRALRVLWANVQAGFGIQGGRMPTVAAHVQFPEDGDEPIGQLLLRATTHAMAAAIGGADQIYVPSVDGDQPRGARLARNVQHLLRLETDLAWVADPAAGSYYIEALTTQLVEAAWAQFRKIEEQGGFAGAVNI
ncbi:MAG: methylmalonyl-CoA mutase family protein [Saprospiraceae bacterium]